MKRDVFGNKEHRECPRGHVHCTNVRKGSQFEIDYKESQTHHVGVFAYDIHGGGLADYVPVFREMNPLEKEEYAQINP